MKRTTLCSDCLRRSRCCPFCQSFNREVWLEKRCENSLLLKAIEIKTNPNSGKRYLSVIYLLTCDPEIAFHPSKSNYAQARQNSIRLRKKLLKHNLLQSFDNQLNSDLEAGFCEILKGVESLAGFNTKLTVEQQCVRLRISATCFPLRISQNPASMSLFNWLSKLCNKLCFRSFFSAVSNFVWLVCSWISTDGRRFLDRTSAGR